MISFKELNEENSSLLAAELTSENAALRADVEEIISSFAGSLDEAGFAFCLSEEFLLVRIFDGEGYIFVYPIALTDDADAKVALEKLRLYAVREEIPLILCDVPESSLSEVEDHFRYTEAYAEDDDGASFTVKTLTEISRAPDIPNITDGKLSLRHLAEDDIPDYARLSKNTELNKYWGYDYRADNKNPSDRYFYDVAHRAFDDGVALSLAVDHDGKFVGEATLWGFDLLGSCEIGFRILPEWQGRGFGSSTLALLTKLCDELGIRCIRASVMKENIISLSIIEKKMSLYRQTDSINYYMYELK
ncbi:MAG: GNAT family N-acetyltransferase [Clostridia bacterium]|nr:GNAT family N-acetyltransferase [Clostridia bacterium]